MKFQKILKIAFGRLSRQLKVDEDFIVDIHDDENSWSFISKLAQLIEGVFTQTLTQRLDEPEIFDAISNLSQATRIALAHDLKIIDKNQKFLFLTIAEIRNDYIHNISNVNSSLKNYLSDLKLDRKKEIFKRLKPFLNDKDATVESFVEDIRDTLFLACALEMVKMHGNVEELDSERKHRKFRAEQAEKLLPKKSEESINVGDKFAILEHIKNATDVLKKNGLL